MEPNYPAEDPQEVVQLIGYRDGQPEELVFVALVQDKATYQQMAAMPEQDAWFHRMAEHVDGEVRWEDVEMEWGTWSDLGGRPQ